MSVRTIKVCVRSNQILSNAHRFGQKLDIVASETHVNSYMTEEHVSHLEIYDLTAPLIYRPLFVDLQGWQLDKLAENATKDVGDVSESDSDEDIPFACLICRKHYTDPVVTRCGHYFCSACAIKRFAKTPRCIACGAPTGGIFNRADKIIEKANKSRKQKEDDGETEDNPTDKVEIEGLGAEEASNNSNDDSD